MRSRLLCLFLISSPSFGVSVDFARDVQPILAEHCLECHGPDKSKGGLLLTTSEGAQKKLKSGARGVVPGDARHSAVIERVLSTDADEKMPPKEKKPLKPEEIERLKRWIDAGAKYDLHWAYKPLADLRSQVAGFQQAGITHPIDGFVRAKLTELKLKPSPEAEPVTLLKRACYDLLGLQPTPEEVDEFLADAAAAGGKGSVPDAVWAKWLTRLMSNQHFGERWGRHWLDAARYADSDGYEKDRPRPDAWRYRDWVIKAVNDDVPFDQFTIQQLAGDLLPGATPDQVLATAFNRQTLTNTEGGTDQEQFRVEAVMDRTETMGTVWLGLTVGCARCHSHKYDQISQREYYQLMAFFNNGDEVVRQVPESSERWSAYQKQTGAAGAKLVELQRKVDEAKAALPVKLPAWEQEVKARYEAAQQSGEKQTFATLELTNVSAKSKAKLKAQKDGSWLVSGALPATDTYALEVASTPSVVAALQLEVLPDESLPKLGPGRKDNGNFVLTEVTVTANGSPVSIASATADYTQKKFDPKDVFDGKDQTGWAISGGIGKAHTLTLQLMRPVSVGAKLEIKLAQDYAQANHVIGRFRMLASAVQSADAILPPAIAKILAEEPKRRNPVVIQPLYDYMAKVDPEVIAATAALENMRAKLPKPPLMDVRVIAQRASNPRETHVLHRGDFLDPAEVVQPAVFATLPKLASAQPSRLDLAKWLVSKNNPLTPRVTVNQVWGKLFGEGLVKTAADFGVRGERPSHPELLDFLARKFIELGWSRKQLLQFIMMSATYRQSSAQPAAGATVLDIDPKNQWLWRQNRLRVEGEIVRDLHLAASGLLSPKVGGPSVFPPMPPDVAELSYANNFKWATSQGEDAHRRGLYTFFKRTAPYPDLTTFDCPDANLTNIKRTVSNTPLQALTTLNAEPFAEASRAMGRRLLTESLKSDGDRLVRCVRLCLSRSPGERELESLKRLLDDSRGYYRDHEPEAKAMAGSFAVKGIANAECAAWISVARIVMNLDEMITRD